MIFTAKQKLNKDANIQKCETEVNPFKCKKIYLFCVFDKTRNLMKISAIILFKIKALKCNTELLIIELLHF